jgi:hypothetical protein
MLIRDYPFLDPRRITSELSDRLRALADDCTRLQHDTGFVSAQLPTAPLLERYVPVTSALGIRLAGEVTGHPLLGARKIITSQVWFADPEGHWIRTLSRFYRLGRPAGET